MTNNVRLIYAQIQPEGYIITDQLSPGATMSELSLLKVKIHNLAVTAAVTFQFEIINSNHTGPPGFEIYEVQDSTFGTSFSRVLYNTSETVKTQSLKYIGSHPLTLSYKQITETNFRESVRIKDKGE